jgi:hypothetical protein
VYGKIFDSMYDGTLARNWQALVTFQQMIVLSDADGIVDMTPDSISRRTSIPLEIIEAGIKVLESPDPHSRTPDNEGRRIERLDDHRPWGWHLVNHEKYKNLKDADEVRKQNRERQQRFREKNGVTPRNAASRKVTRGNEESRYTDTDIDKENLPTPNGVGVPDASGTRIPECPHVLLVAAYHELLPMCPMVVDWTQERQAIMRSRWREKAISKSKNWGYSTEEQGLACWRKFFRYVGESEFLTGRKEGRNGRAPFVASLEWLVRPKNFVKIIEGEYHR